MDQGETSSQPPALPARPAEPSTQKEKNQSNEVAFYAYGAAAASVILGIALTSPKLFFGFLLGAIASAAAIIGGVYYLLNVGVASAAADKQKEIEKKLDQPQLESNVRTSFLILSRFAK